jgi:MarR family transcriptional regulator, negative regulator of the multidrug operon emrRAB
MTHGYIRMCFHDRKEMKHPSNPQVSPRSTNLLGAFALAAGHELRSVTEQAASHTASGPSALTALATWPGLSLDGLRKTLDISQPGVVRLVDRLAADGLVSRNPGPDGRTRALHLTERGKQVAQEILQAREAAMAALCARLEPAEVEQLTTLLERVLEGLPSDREEAHFLCRLCDHEACTDPYCPVDRGVPS